MPRWTQLLLFGLFTSTTQLLLHYYVWRRLVRDTNLPQPWRRIATWAIAVLGLGLPFTIWSARLWDASIGQVLGWPVFLWMALVGLTFVGLALTDGVRLVGWGTRKGLERMRRAPAADTLAASLAGSADSGPETPKHGNSAGVPPLERPAMDGVDLGRRQFVARVTGGAVAAAAAGAVGTGLYDVLGGPEVKDVTVVLPRLPEALDGYTIVQLTDVHVGYTISRDYIQTIVDRVNAVRPDAAVITGDLVDGTVEDLGRGTEPLGQIRAAQGTYFVTGNHEYYAGADPWLEELERLGIQVLRNQRVSLGTNKHSFDLMGIDDYQAAQFGNGHGADLAKATKGYDARRELVLLAHQPRHVHEAKRYGVGLQLSGHTHGGQIWPWHFLASAQQGGLLAGLSRHGDTQLYISRGTCYWGPPVRVGAPAEITRVILRAGRA